VAEKETVNEPKDLIEATPKEMEKEEKTEQKLKEMENKLEEMDKADDKDS